jgi:hypothetical protein
MFMTNYELIYGSYKETSNDSIPLINNETTSQTYEDSKGTETAVRVVSGAHIAAAKFAGGAISKLSKKAVDYGNSDVASEKVAFAKEKAGSIFNGLKDRATGFAANHKNNTDENALYNSDMNAPINEYDNVGDNERNGVNLSSTGSALTQIPQASFNTRQFYYEEEKKSPVIYVLVGVIGILLLGIGVLGGMLLMKNKTYNKVPDSNESTAAVVTESNLATADNAKTTPIASTTVTAITTESSALQIKEYPSNEISKYPQYIDAIKECIASSIFTVNDANYSLIDLNGDDISELLIQSGNGSGIYGIIDNHYVELIRTYGALRPPAFIFTDKGYLHMTSIEGAGSQVYESFSQYSGGTKLDGVDSFECNLANQTYSHNSSSISSDEYEKLRSQYGQSIELSLTPISNIADINNLITTTNAPKPYISAQLIVEQGFQGIGINLNVSGDYSYYTYESYEYGPLTKNPTTKSGNSSEQEISITAFDGGINKVVVNVTPYNSNGVSGDMVSATYTRESSNVKAITSCNKYGNIYSPSGNKVDGLTRSYLIDGGSATYERHDLTDGWHIVAVNAYYDGSVYWYELYDADDGDYYGWVNENNITFY